MAQNNPIDTVRALKLHQKHLQNQIHNSIVAFQRNTGFTTINVEINRFANSQVELDAECKEVLYTNLWNLYT